MRFKRAAPLSSLPVFAGLLASSATLAVAEIGAPAPLLPVPNAAQMRWHKAEYIMFAHYGMKTFHPSGNHMGSGDEDPKSYDPAKCDVAQWVEAAKAGGFKGIVLTTKHHDGFCNWRTDTTDHSVKKAAWKDGAGDVVKDLTEACRKNGVYFGLYVSIIDEHFRKFGAPGYKDYASFYFDQIKELSTRYGRVDEYWFDGFNATGLNIDYPKIAAMIKETQPEAVIYDSGMLVKSLPDRCVAWPGHHGGLAPEQEYVQKIDGVDRWYPNEASIILQGNWFHVGAPSVGVRQMQDLYLSSTGVGSTPLMNIPPNKDGLIDEETIAKLKEFKAWVDGLHSNNLARADGVKSSDAGHRGSDERYAAGKALDDDYDSYFSTDDGKAEATLEVILPKAQKIGGFIIQEYIPLGQRIEDYSIECRVNGQWRPVFAGRKIGYKRIILEGRSSTPALTFDEGDIDIHQLDDAPAQGGKLKLPIADGVRLKVRKAKACPLINNFQIIGGEEDEESRKTSALGFTPVDGAKLSYTASSLDSRWSGERDTLLRGGPQGSWAFHTLEEKSPFITIDLKQSRQIGAVGIDNRDDMSQDRAKGLTMSASDDGVTWTKIWQAETVGASWLALPGSGDGKAAGIRARYLRLGVSSDIPTYFHLKAVRLYEKR